MRLILSGLIALYVCLMVPSPLQAADTDPLRYDQVNLSAEASQETDNDTLIAVLAAQKEGSDPAALSGSINRLIEQAVAEAKKEPAIKVQTLGYQTSPTYQQQRLSGWRVKQSLRLESRNSEVLSQLLGRLQNTLALESISYAISDEQRSAVEEALITRALDAFEQRARLITKQLGRESYRLVQMRVINSGQSAPRMPMRASSMLMEAAAPPTLEAGTQTLRVEVSGTIELQLK
jgi:predicted secreted protein